jgi:hypothetical protein
LVKIPVYVDELGLKPQQRVLQIQKMKEQISAFVIDSINNKFTPLTPSELNVKYPIAAPIIKAYLKDHKLDKDCIELNNQIKSITNRIFRFREISHFDDLKQYDVKDVNKISKINVKQKIDNDPKNELVLAVDNLIKNIIDHSPELTQQYVE